MSKRPYKKVKLTDSTDQPNDDESIVEEIAKVTNRPRQIIRSHIDKDLLKNMNPAQVRYVSKAIRGLSKMSWVDYLNFILHPIASPRKVRMPGIIQGPLGTQVRCFKHFITHTTVNSIWDTMFCWSPGQVHFSAATGSTANTFDNGKVLSCNFMIGQINDTTTPVGTLNQDDYTKWTVTDVRKYWPDNMATYFQQYRLLAAECRINAIQPEISGTGRVVSSMTLRNNDAVQIWPTNTATFVGTNPSKNNTIKRSLDDLFDNRIVHDSNIMDGLRMVYIPGDVSVQDWINIDASSTADKYHGQYTRYDYNGIIRGLPNNTKIEAYMVYYYEFQVQEDMAEVMWNPDAEIGGSRSTVTGTIEDVLSSLQGIENMAPKIFSLEGNLYFFLI